jgi:hypothetical protein
MIRASVWERLSAYDKDARLTTKEISSITGIPAGTISGHRYSGLLQFIPGRPVYHRVGDVKLYLKLVGTDTNSGKFHRSLRVAHADRVPYNPLHGVDFDDGRQSEVMTTVIDEMNKLWNRYKAEGTLPSKKKTKAKK